MNETGLKIKISLVTEELKKGMDNAKKQVNSFKDQVKKASKDVDNNFKSMGQSISNSLKGATIAIGAAAASLTALGASTTEYRNEQAKLVSAFESAGASAATAKDTYNDLYRVLGDSGQAVEAAQHLGKLTTEEKALSEWTNICQGIYAEFGSSLPLESLTEAVNHSSKLGEVQGSLADALEWSGVNVDSFNESLAACNTEAEREKLIRETLSGMYSESAAKYEKNNAQILAQNEAQARLQETTAKLGEKMQPVITAFTNFANDALAAAMPYISSLAEKLVPKLEKALKKAGDIIGTVFKYIKDNWQFLTAMAGVIGGIAAAIGLYNIAAAIKAAMAAVEVTTVWGLVAAYAAQAVAMMAALAPYLLIVAAIAAVIAIIVLCVKHWDEIKAAVKVAVDAIVGWVTGLWTSITDGLSAAWEFVSGILSAIGSWIYDNVIAPIINFFVGLWQAIIDDFNAKIMPWIEIIKRISVIIYEKVIVPIIEYFKKLWEDIKAVFAIVGSWFNEKVIQPTVNFFKNMWSGLKEGASKAWEGIKNIFSSVATFFKDIFSKAWTGVKNVFSVGGKIFEGIKEGITSVFKTVVNSIIGGINKIITVPFKAINTALSKIKGIEIVGVKPFNWIKTFDIPQIPLLAKGGIVDSATLSVIGEQGKEAVVPLENNTEWIDMLEARLNRKSSTPIILQVDGKTFGEIAIDSINDLATLTGNLPIKYA